MGLFALVSNRFSVFICRLVDRKDHAPLQLRLAKNEVRPSRLQAVGPKGVAITDVEQRQFPSSFDSYSLLQLPSRAMYVRRDLFHSDLFNPGSRLQFIVFFAPWRTFRWLSTLHRRPGLRLHLYTIAGSWVHTGIFQSPFVRTPISTACSTRRHQSCSQRTGNRGGRLPVGFFHCRR